MNTNLNPKVLHLLLEVVKIGAVAGSVKSFVGVVNPVASTVCAVLAAVAAAIQTNIIGNIPSSNP